VITLIMSLNLRISLGCSSLRSFSQTRFLTRKSSSGQPDPRSPFVRAIDPNSLLKIPPGMLAFHATGGHCEGPLLVNRGKNGIADIVATLGCLPQSSPVTTSEACTPPIVEVTSTFCAATGGVQWHRNFWPSLSLESRWYFDEPSQLAIDSFTYLGIRDFAAFGFALEPEDAPHTPDSGFVGFRHVTKKAWILGVPVPLALSLVADGVSMPHEDGLGWRVEVCVEHALLGTIVEYLGDVRLLPGEPQN